MKKRDEGYVLPLVLIVLVVICLIAVSLLTVSLNNLKNQQAMIDRMEDQYAAQGLVESAVLQLKETPPPSSGENSVDLSQIESQIEIETDKTIAIITSNSSKYLTWSVNENTASTNNAVIIKAECKSTQVYAEVTFTATKENGNWIVSEIYNKYEISRVEVTKNG